MTESSRRRHPTIVDLFCGVGGFSLGAERAGFRGVASVEIDPVIMAGYRRNFPKTRTVLGDASAIDGHAWNGILGAVRPDGVVGGPPCQGFSRIGKRRVDDPRNSLIHHFYRHVATLRPKFFVMENVEGILDGPNVGLLRDAMSTLAGKYVVSEPFVVNAADFGAATNRRRTVVVGYDPDEMNPVGAEDLAPKPLRSRTSVFDAIADLPAPAASKSAEIQWIPYPETASLSAYAKRMRRTPRTPNGRRGVEKLRCGLVSGLMPTAHAPAVVERFRATPAGRAEPISKSYRLQWEGLCPTLRAGTGMDKGAFQAVRPIHPDGERVITVREAARMQGFPDYFEFSSTIWHSFRMLGNSVSPAMSEGLLRRIRSSLA